MLNCRATLLCFTSDMLQSLAVEAIKRFIELPLMAILDSREHVTVEAVIPDVHQHHSTAGQGFKKWSSAEGSYISTQLVGLF